MALRRPPTRIELKAEDIEEYEQIRREREMAAEDEAAAAVAAAGAPMASSKRKPGSRQHDPAGFPASSPRLTRKQMIADRIGISGQS